MEAPDAPAPTYIETMAACETMAIEILGFPDGRTRYPGGVVDALTFPPGLQNQPLDALLPWALMKKQTLSSFLALLKGPVAGQAPPILAAAAVSATPPLPTRLQLQLPSRSLQLPCRSLQIPRRSLQLPRRSLQIHGRQSNTLLRGLLISPTRDCQML